MNYIQQQENLTIKLKSFEYELYTATRGLDHKLKSFEYELYTATRELDHKIEII